MAYIRAVSSRDPKYLCMISPGGHDSHIARHFRAFVGSCYQSLDSRQRTLTSPNLGVGGHILKVLSHSSLGRGHVEMMDWRQIAWVLHLDR